MRRCRNTSRHDYTSRKWRHKSSHLSRVTAAVIAGAIVEVVTPISFETILAVAVSTVVDTLAPTEGANVCVTCACEDDCNDCDDAEAPLLVDLVIVFKALPLLKCMHKMRIFPQKRVYQK